MGRTVTTHVPATAAHATFVINAWLSALKNLDTSLPVQMEDYRHLIWGQLVKAMNRPGAETLVAVGDDPDVYLGFICFDRTSVTSPYVYFAYVKEAYRRSGVALGMFAAADIDPTRHLRYACHTPVVDRIRERTPYGRFARWDPMYARSDVR